VQFHVGIPDGIVSIRRCCGQPLALSPDGQTRVFPGNTGAEAGALYRRELGRLSAERIPGTERGASPFFSPNGEWLGFETAGTLMKVRLAGGPVLKIAESGPVSSATWTDRDQIVFAVTGTGNHLWMVSAAGGQPVPIMGQDSTPVRGVPYPVALPGGRAVLSTGGGGDLAERRIVAVELETGRVDTIAIGTNAAYADGHLFIGGADGTLSVQPFDLAARKTTGEPIIILNGLARSGPWMLAFAVSAGGALAYEQAPVAGSFNQGQYSILMETSVMRAADSSRGSAAPAARNVPLPDPKPVGVFEPAISPDGRRVVYRVPSLSGTSMREAIGDLYLLDWQTGTTSRFTSGVARNPVWSRDGRHVTYSVPVGPASPGGIYSRAVDLSGAPELIVRGQARPSSWTPDGRLLVTRGDNLTGNMDIGIVTPGDSAPRWIVQTPSNELNPVVSADGAWLGFVRESRIWLQPLDAVGEPVQISAELGMQPRWSRTGQTLYYISSPDNTLVRATLSGATVVGRETISTPMAALGNTVGSASWDIFPDGGRFIFVEQVPGGETPQLAVVWQWQALVRSMKGKQW
jgi:Tol biopolymer transport system component